MAEIRLQVGDPDNVARKILAIIMACQRLKELGAPNVVFGDDDKDDEFFNAPWFEIYEAVKRVINRRLTPAETEAIVLSCRYQNGQHPLLEKDGHAVKEALFYSSQKRDTPHMEWLDLAEDLREMVIRGVIPPYWYRCSNIIV